MKKIISQVLPIHAFQAIEVPASDALYEIFHAGPT
jgi:hypothetical protein